MVSGQLVRVSTTIVHRAIEASSFANKMMSSRMEETATVVLAGAATTAESSVFK